MILTDRHVVIIWLADRDVVDATLLPVCVTPCMVRGGRLKFAARLVARELACVLSTAFSLQDRTLTDSMRARGFDERIDGADATTSSSC